jgi:hypothetical protein
MPRSEPDKLSTPPPEIIRISWRRIRPTSYSTGSSQPKSGSRSRSGPSRAQNGPSQCSFHFGDRFPNAISVTYAYSLARPAASHSRSNFFGTSIDFYSRAESPRKPCRFNCGRPGKLNLTIWNGAIYCTPVAAVPHMVSRRCTMAYKLRTGHVVGPPQRQHCASRRGKDVSIKSE